MWIEKKRLALLSLVVMGGVVFGGIPEAWAQQKWRLAVVEFENKAPGEFRSWGPRLGHAASDMLATSLVKTGKFSVIEREKLKAILNEQALGKSGAVTPQSAAQVGRLLGVKYIVTGAVSEFGVTKKGGQILGIGGTQNTARATVDIRLVDTNSGEIILADTASSTDSFSKVQVFGSSIGTDFDETMATRTMRGAIDTLTAKIVDQVGAGTAGAGGAPARWEARIAQISGSRIVINAGSGGGVKAGQILDVISMGEEIKDPQTGQTLGAEEQKVGSLEITDVKEKYSIARVRSGETSKFKVNDIVRQQ